MVPVFESRQWSKSESDATAEVCLFQGTVVAMHLLCLPVISTLQAFSRVIRFISCVYARDLNGSCYSYQKLVHPCCMRMCPTGLWSKTSRWQKETHHLSATTHEYCTEEKFWVAAVSIRSVQLLLLSYKFSPSTSSFVFRYILRLAPKVQHKKKKRKEINLENDVLKRFSGRKRYNVNRMWRHKYFKFM